MKEILPLLAFRLFTLAFRLFAFAFSLSTFAFPRLWQAAGRGVKASSVRQPEICEKQARGACVHSARNEERETRNGESGLPPSPTEYPSLKGLRRTRQGARTFRKTDSSSFFSFASFASCRFRQDGDAFYHFINRVIFPNFFQQVFESAMQINAGRVFIVRRQECRAHSYSPYSRSHMGRVLVKFSS